MLSFVAISLLGASRAVPTHTDRPWLDPSVPSEKRADDLIGALTLPEKIQLMSTDNPGIARLGLPAYGFWSEAAHGVAWAGRATVFPAGVGLAATFDAEAMAAVGKAIGFEGRGKHNDYAKNNKGQSKDLFGLTFFAPNINIVRDVRWGRSQETFGEDPFLTATLAVPLIRGMQSNASYGSSYPLVSATAKHFFAYNLESNFAAGGTDGQYRLRANVNVSVTDLIQTYFPAFDAAVKKAEVRSVMCSYNAINGIPACGHPMIQSRLRDHNDFKGFVVSDCGAIGWMGPTKHNFTHSDPESAALGVHAGTDINCGDCYSSALGAAVTAGLVTEADLDVSLRRTMAARVELGLLDPVGTNPLQDIGMDVVDSSDHRALALKVAIESIVLLKNDGAALPLKPAAKVAVIGPNANRTLTLLSNYPGCKNSPGGPIDPTCHLVNPLDGMAAAAKVRGGTVTFSQGSEIDGGNVSMIPAAVAAAKAANVVVLVGGIITCQEHGMYCQEAEAKDRTNVTLPAIQQQLVKAVAATGTPVILVLMGGATVSTPWAAGASSVPGIVQLWYPGEEGGTALASVLYGAENPSGRLSETVFTGVEQLPTDYLSMTMSDAPGRTHRYFGGTPLFGFGFGLSYSKRVWSNLKLSTATLSSAAGLASSDAVDTVTVTSEVTCTAGMAGVEVAQIYTALRTTDRFTGNRSVPLRELKGFKRVALDKCPGPAIEVSFQLVAADLALVDSDGVLKSIPGTYDVWVGTTGPVTGLHTTALPPLHTTLTIT